MPSPQARSSSCCRTTFWRSRAPPKAAALAGVAQPTAVRHALALLLEIRVREPGDKPGRGQGGPRTGPECTNVLEDRKRRPDAAPDPDRRPSVNRRIEPVVLPSFGRGRVEQRQLLAFSRTRGRRLDDFRSLETPIVAYGIRRIVVEFPRLTAGYLLGQNRARIQGAVQPGAVVVGG